jgi:hypothetical protein
MPSNSDATFNYVQVFNFNFDCRRWYFIAVSHVYHFIRRSEAALYVDSKLKCTIALTYPRVDPPVTRCFVGCNGEVQPQIRQPLRGQLGQLFFFQEAISESDLKAIFVLGPNMTPIYDREYVNPSSFFFFFFFLSSS